MGSPGQNSGIRTLPGGEQEASDIFDEWSKELGAKPVTKPGYPGRGAELPDGGGFIGLRPRSKSGPPTIDVNIPGIGVREVKFQ